MKSREDLKKIAIDFADGKIFTSDLLPDMNLLPQVFVPIALNCFKDIPEEDIKKGKLWVIYEYYDKAGPRSINGYPIFFSLNYLSKEEAEVTNDLLHKYIKLKSEFEVNV
jgi:hypothetical protein